MNPAVASDLTPELLEQVSKGEAYEAMVASEGWKHLTEAMELIPNTFLEKMRTNESQLPDVALNLMRRWQVALEIRAEILDEVKAYINAKNQILKDHNLTEGDE